MSMLNKDETSIYDHFEETDPLCVPVDMDWLAEHLYNNNYMIVRLFAAIVRNRRRKWDESISEYRRLGHHDIIERMQLRGDPIQQALIHLLVNDKF